MKADTIRYYLVQDTPDALQPAECPEPSFDVQEWPDKQFLLNRFLYRWIGRHWRWLDRLAWDESAWRVYAEADNVRTWVAYLEGLPAGYYELRKLETGDVEIAIFGLAKPYIGRGLGACLLTHAIRSAWAWQARRVMVQTCSHDHPVALENYLARGMKIARREKI